MKLPIVLGAWGLPALAVVVIVVGSMIPLGAFIHPQLVAEMANALHYPSGLLLTLLLAARVHSMARLWAIAAAGVALFGLIEIVQPYAGRDGNIPDWLHSSAGVIVAALFLWVRHKGLVPLRRPVITAGLALLLVFSAPLFRQLLAMQAYAGMFPVLANFEQPDHMLMWKAGDGIKISRAGHGQLQTELGLQDQHYARVRTTRIKHGMVVYATVKPDWRGFGRLCLDSRAVAEGQVLRLRLDEVRSSTDRTLLHFDFPLTTQWQQHCVDLTQLKRHDGEPLDLSNMRYVTLWLAKPSRGAEYHFDNLRLLP